MSADFKVRGAVKHSTWYDFMHEHASFLQTQTLQTENKCHWVQSLTFLWYINADLVFAYQRKMAEQTF